MTTPFTQLQERWKSQPRRLGMLLVSLPQVCTFPLFVAESASTSISNPVLFFIEFPLLRCNKSGSIHPIGTPFPDKVVPKELSEEDFAVYKFFQGKTQAQLGRLIMDTPIDTVENKRLFMRVFLLFVQKTFLLATSSANVTPRTYPTLYDVENTKQRNRALYVHNFLLEELKKAKENKTKSVHGCCYALLIIYFHETQFGKNSREPIAQPPWIDYWNGRTLWDRMKQEKRDAAGLVRTKKLRAQKEKKQKKSKKSPSSESEWESESETDTEGYVPDESEEDSDSEDTRSEELVQRKSRPEPNLAQEERRSKKRHESNDATEAHSGPEHEPLNNPASLKKKLPFNNPNHNPNNNLLRMT
ncbi:hypothetical protein PIB30_062482 [Stylosanthes scabra]|uniref:Uncharacterized protein n=1 Tax=Stylosanthes scabra TaxID=79078 RepID=A0ABU6QKX1_9FABA|nr:hypothetical protein [Stylosanthes scabra]